MAFTYTRTKTNVYIPGNELAAQNEKLEQALHMMTKIETKYTDQLHEAGVQFEVTNDPNKISFIKYQWAEVMPTIVPKGELTEINELLGDKNSEASAEFRLGKK